MNYDELIFAAAVQAEARATRDRELKNWIEDAQGPARNERSNQFQEMFPMSAYVRGAYRDIQATQKVIEQIRKEDEDRLLSGQNPAPPANRAIQVEP